MLSQAFYELSFKLSKYFPLKLLPEQNASVAKATNRLKVYHLLHTLTSMFGGPVTASINSPHLRKSGSRAVVLDPGDELGNGVENGHLHPLEVNGLRSASIPVVTVAIVPSPTLLWRLKACLQ
ncbi:hypothetical protein PTKIN_Ptkin02bG0130700 [Pterospermum kingtungense]